LSLQRPYWNTPRFDSYLCIDGIAWFVVTIVWNCNHSIILTAMCCWSCYKTVVFVFAVKITRSKSAVKCQPAAKSVMIFLHMLLKHLCVLYYS